MFARKFRVTESLKKKLPYCCPSEEMKKIYNLKILTLKHSPIQSTSNVYKLNFFEIHDGYWLYSKSFYNELVKNEIHYNHLSLE